MEGEKGHARLQPDMAPLWADWSAASVIRQLYAWIGLEGWSCDRVARELNALGVPTHYARDGRLVSLKGERRVRTQGLWRAGRIRNLVVSPIYRSEASFGKRSLSKDRSVITASVEPLVSVELWQAAQETLFAQPADAQEQQHRQPAAWCHPLWCGGTGLHQLARTARRLLPLRWQPELAARLAQLETERAEIETERAEIERRMAALVPPIDAQEPELEPEQLDQPRQRLDNGLTPQERHEIVRLLVSIVVETDVATDGDKQVRLLVRYRFPDVVSTRTGSGSWPRRAFARASPRGGG